MLQYRLFYLDNFRLAGSELLTAKDDLDAMLQCLRRADGREVEIWKDGRKFRTFPMAPAPIFSAMAHTLIQQARARAFGG